MRYPLQGTLFLKVMPDPILQIVGVNAPLKKACLIELYHIIIEREQSFRSTEQCLCREVRALR